MSQHPTPIALAPVGGGDATHYACGVCKHVTGWADPGGYAFHAAEKCCSTVCETCGEVKPIRGYCSPCSSAREDATELKNFEKAEKIPAGEHVGPVYSPRSDRYWGDVGEALEWYDDENTDRPGYLWACSVETLGLDADAVVDSALESLAEGTDVEALPELREFLEKWNAKQTHQSWWPDYSRAVVLPGREP